jgi:superfamily II DNA helicase RecQ
MKLPPQSFDLERSPSYSFRKKPRINYEEETILSKEPISEKITDEEPPKYILFLSKETKNELSEIFSAIEKNPKNETKHRKIHTFFKRYKWNDNASNKLKKFLCENLKKLEKDLSNHMGIKKCTTCYDNFKKLNLLEERKEKLKQKEMKKNYSEEDPSSSLLFNTSNPLVMLAEISAQEDYFKKEEVQDSPLKRLLQTVEKELSQFRDSNLFGPKSSSNKKKISSIERSVTIAKKIKISDRSPKNTRTLYEKKEKNFFIQIENSTYTRRKIEIEPKKMEARHSEKKELDIIDILGFDSEEDIQSTKKN